MMWLPSSKTRNYAKLDETSDTSYDSVSDPYGYAESGRQVSAPKAWTTACFSIVLLLASAIFGAFCERMWAYHNSGSIIEQVSKYGPVLDDVSISFKTQRFNGTFLPTGNPFRGPASPETDAAWSSLGTDYRAMILPESEASASGLTSSHVRVHPKYGGGFPVLVEGLHHLHCLNLLRKSNPWNIDYYKKLGIGPFSDSDEILKDHVTHCLDVLRQQLMCQVDIAVFGQVWMNGSKGLKPFVDFHTDHVCRNFEDVRDWAGARQLDKLGGKPDDYLLPPSGYVYQGVP